MDMSKTYDKTLQDYIKADRQWTRPCRIAFAQHQLAAAAQAEKKFWLDVLAANGVEVTNG